MSSLALLQNRMKREPGPYVDDFQRQLSHFEAMRTLIITQSTPQTSKEMSKQFGKLGAFLAAVSSCYPNHGGKRVPELIISLLEQNGAELQPDLRMKLLQSLILLRAKNVVSADRLIEVCFGLFKIRDKPFRAALYTYIVKDVRVVNKLKTNVELNRTLQSLVFRMLSDDERTAGTPAAAKRALSVVIELYKRRVWVDVRAVNVVADACFSRIPRNAVAAARFFLGIDEEIDDLLAKDADDEDDGNPMNVGTKRDEQLKKLRSSLTAPKVAKQTKKKMRKRHRVKAQLKKLDKEDPGLVHEAKTSEAKRLYAPRFPAIDLIHDPQTFVEKLLKTVRSSSDRFEVRLIQLNLVSRVIGHHKLLLFPFYSFCMKYLQPFHEHINGMLACVIQGSHNLVPPEELDPVVKQIANNFINDRTGSEIVALGLNSIRELINRVPLLTEEDGMRDLIADLVAYRKQTRDRSVIIAARTLLLELRRINPRVLAPKERGKNHNMNNKPLAYGVEAVSDGVDGVDLLEDWLAQHGEDEVLEDDDHDIDEEDFEEGDEDDDEEYAGGDLDESDDEMEEEDEEEGGSEEHEDIPEEDDAELDEDAPKEETASVKSGGTSQSSKRLDARRLLTDEDFRKIRALKKLEAEGKIKRKAPDTTAASAVATPSKRLPKVIRIMGQKFVQEEIDDIEELDNTHDGQSQTTFDVDSLGSSENEDSDAETKPYDPSVVDPSSLDGVKKKNRRELAEKLKQIQEQNDAKKAAKRTRVINNTEKAKRTKDFMMVQKSRHVRNKQMMSMKDQQHQLSKHIKSLKTKSKLLTKIRRKG